MHCDFKHKLWLLHCSGIEDQLKLIAAARDAGTVKRFVPSEFGAHTSAACNSGIAGRFSFSRGRGVVRNAAVQRTVFFMVKGCRLIIVLFSW